MKTVKTLVQSVTYLILLFILLAISYATDSNSTLNKQPISFNSLNLKLDTLNNTSTVANPKLVCLIVTEKASRILRVSFNGSERGDGQLRIYDSANVMVKEADFELIKSPYYASINISNLPKGSYTAILKTSISTYSTSINIE